ncbi:unnamed protein product, partial [Ilex paraguariensis]
VSAEVQAEDTRVTLVSDQNLSVIPPSDNTAPIPQTDVSTTSTNIMLLVGIADSLFASVDVLFGDIEGGIGGNITGLT